MNTASQTAYPTDERRWNAVLERAPRAEAAFVYAVRTTGVYCRPTCASRLPNRENIAFFATHEEAELAGFRPCRKCRPESVVLPSSGLRPIVRACRMIERSEEPPALRELADAVGLSPQYFHRLFKRLVGLTPKGFAEAVRSNRLRAGLLAGADVTTAIFDAGFGSSSRGYESARTSLGMTPSQYRKRAAGMRIRFTIAESYLGPVLVAATERGICAIELGASAQKAPEALRERFPGALISRDDSGFGDRAGRVVSFLEDPSRGLDLPLDIRGTAFQQRVWEALRDIPAGATATYAEIAERIGRPSAARAVARACASNRLAVAVPCHRVVLSGGRPGGYRWGTRRKRALLAREAGVGTDRKPVRAR